MAPPDSVYVQMHKHRDILWSHHHSGSYKGRYAAIHALSQFLKKNPPDVWDACRKAEVPSFLIRIMLDELTYHDLNYIERIFQLAAYIMTTACPMEAGREQPISRQFLAAGEGFWELIFSMREKFVAGCRAPTYQPFRSSFVELVAAYGLLYKTKNHFPNTLESKFARLLLYTWVRGVDYGKIDVLSIIFKHMACSPQENRRPFCNASILDCGGPDAFAKRCKAQFERPDLSREAFRTCSRLMIIFNPLVDGNAVVSALADNDVLRPFYGSFCRLTDAENTREDWNSFQQMSEILWSIFCKCVNARSSDSFRYTEYLIFFLSRAVMYAPRFDRLEGINTGRWVQLCESVCQFLPKGKPQEAIHIFLVEVIQRHWKPTADVLSGYISEGLIDRKDPNLVKMIIAWKRLGSSIGLAPGR
ncbi:hypothetical protein EVG20_g11531 [Dentipellis fragilis]|uniref:Uncharacterized protein n=1 Tax=Dentipellis fragilis TaxID=205917 RepID=A0A4Y9XL43_9AGAM|nr:hypothetical protein EVG20_g11531 [Dentipellis fragilis]